MSQKELHSNWIRNILLLAVCVVGLESPTGFATSKEPDSRYIRALQSLNRPKRQGQNDWDLLKELLPAEPIAIKHEQLLPIEGYPILDRIGGRANRLKFTFKQSPVMRSRMLVLEWEKNGGHVAFMNFAEDQNLPFELELLPKGNRVEVHLWADGSHRMYFDARHLVLEYDLDGKLRHVTANRFHKSSFLRRAISARMRVD